MESRQTVAKKSIITACELRACRGPLNTKSDGLKSQWNVGSRMKGMIQDGKLAQCMYKSCRLVQQRRPLVVWQTSAATGPSTNQSPRGSRTAMATPDLTILGLFSVRLKDVSTPRMAVLASRRVLLLRFCYMILHVLRTVPLACCNTYIRGNVGSYKAVRKSQDN